MTDAIFARASGAGKAGVAVYRLSGSDAHRIAGKLIGKRMKMREAALAALRDPADGTVIDRGLALFFKGPASFTGEDVAEFHLHGSRAVEASLYETLARLGARPAQPGEFTLRALENGKLDLAQVEALADLIDAETTLQKKQALGQFGGRLSAAAEGWRSRLLAAMAPLEADIDFPDEDGVPAAVAARAGPVIADLKTELTEFLLSSGRARTIREGVLIAVIGPPNAGKSSLANALAGSDVAIVSETPGTTRDVVKTRLDLGGIVATLADTAGLRSLSTDEIEKAGMARALALGETADMRLLIVDSTQCVSRETLLKGEDETVSRETLALLKPGDFIVWNKSDRAAAPKDGSRAPYRECSVSALTGAGMAAFVEALAAAVAREPLADAPALTRVRHVKAVEAAIEALNRAETHLAASAELAAEDVRIAARALGQITGVVGVEDVLSEIFSSFCIGK